MIELVMVVAVGIILAAFAVPVITGEMEVLRLNSAAVSAAGAISATRYQAIMHGYKYQIAFSKDNLSYQISNEAPPATAFSNVGAAVPITGSKEIAMSAATTLQCNPSGTVQATVGQMNLSLSHAGQTKTITVSNLGDVTITP
jgi:Tfp pilus assembly protein FimT